MAESVIIQFLRGTKAQIDAASMADAGKPFFATDTKEIFVSDGTTKHLVGKPLAGLEASRPAFGVAGRVYVATDTGRMFFDTGVAWLLIAVTDLADLSGSLDDISDGTTYAKVKASELEAGQVKQIRAVSGGVNVTGDTINSHVTDPTIHRSINDSGTGTTDLWSASKIASEIQAAAAGLQPKASVRVIATAPVTLSGLQTIDGISLSADNRILVVGQASGIDNGIYLVKSGAWVRSADLATGSFARSVYAFVEQGATYADSGWICTNDTGADVVGTDALTFTQFTGAATILAGAGLGKTGNEIYVNAGNGIEISADAVTVKPDTVGTATKAPAVAVDANGVGVKIDNSTIGATVGGSLEVKDNGITENKINSTALGNGLTGGSGVKVAVNFEDTNANILEVLRGPGDGAAGVSTKAARADHQHRLTRVDGGTL